MARGRPVEDHRGAIVRGEVATFAALVVGVEDEAVVLETFEKDHANRRRAACAGGRESNRVRLQRSLSFRLAVPALEKDQWIRRRARLNEQLRSRLLRHVLAQLLKGRALQSRDVHLADPKPPRNLRLRHLLVET